MTITELLPWAIFGGISCFVWAIFNHFATRQSRASERLDEMRDPTLRDKKIAGEKQNSVGAMLGKAAPALSKALEPKTELEHSQLEVRLANAGYNSPGAPTVFLAAKVILLVGGITIGAAFGLTRWGMTQNGITAIVIAGGTAFYLAEIVLFLISKSRKDKIFLSMPDALDLLVVCVESGLGLDAAMRRVADELADTAHDVCTEFNLCNMQLQMGRQRRDVLHDLGIRTGVDDMRALAAILIQADKFGSSIAQALRVQSDSMRVKRKHMAEERAQKSSVKMIFPLVLFIFPGIFVILVGPAAIMLINGLEL